MSKTVNGWRAARLLLTSVTLAATFVWAAPAVSAQEPTPKQTPTQTKPQEPTPSQPATQTPTPTTQPQTTNPAPPTAQPAPQSQPPAQTTPAAEGEPVAAAAPADEPLYRDYKGVTLGMSADEARRKLGEPQEKDKVQDFFVLSPSERARVYYDDKAQVSAVIVTFVGKGANAPEAKAILGSEVEAKPDGSMYKLVNYPRAGYWVAYSRTPGDEPLTIITMQKIPAASQ